MDNNKILLFISVVTFFLCSYNYNQYKTSEFDIVKNTIGYKILVIEDSIGVINIDNSINEFVKFLNYVKNNFCGDKKRWVRKIYDYFIINGYEIKNNNFVFGMSLENKVIDCKNLSILFYSASQICNIPVDIIFTREHVFLQVEDNLYFETLNGKFYTIDFYKKYFKKQLNIGSYFIKLSYSNLFFIPYENIGNYFFKKENYLLALQFYHKALLFMPKNPSIYNNIGNSYTLLNLWNQAIENYNIALELDPYNADYYNNLGLLFLNINRFKISRRFFEKAISLNPKKADYYANLSIALYQLKEYKLALQKINIALKLEPEQNNYNFIKSIIYFVSGDYINGEKFYKKALK